MTEFCILVTGRGATGKSSLINGIVGLKVEDEGAAIENKNPILQETCTAEVKEYHCTKKNVQLRVLDTPGLRTGTYNDAKYLQQMKEKSRQNIDLMIYCIKSSETRFVADADNEEVPVMKMLTNAFGEGIWEKTVIALTFANIIEELNVGWKRLSPGEKTVKFNKKIVELEKKIRMLLIAEVKIDESIVRNVKFVPAGYHEEPSLPDREFWLSDVWFNCLETIKTSEGKTAFLSMNASRIKERHDLHEGDFHRDIEKQPIVPYDQTKKEMLARLAKFGLAGLVTGSIIGAATTSGIAVPITAAVGAVAGVCVGYFSSYFRNNKETK